MYKGGFLQKLLNKPVICELSTTKMWIVDKFVDKYAFLCVFPQNIHSYTVIYASLFLFFTALYESGGHRAT